MKEFVQYLLEQIVTNEGALLVEESGDGDKIDIRIHVAPEDMGLVIGKEGRTIRSIRSLAKAKAIKENVFVNVELVEPGEGASEQAVAEEDEESTEEA